jgi:hypothetical protein
MAYLASLAGKIDFTAGEVSYNFEIRRRQGFDLRHEVILLIKLFE